MSANKMKYYEVNIRTMIRANSQRDAIAIAFGENRSGEVLDQQIEAERIMASEVNSISLRA
jgi:hypothetical protein